jgi:hypothetical protein
MPFWSSYVHMTPKHAILYIRIIIPGDMGIPSPSEAGPGLATLLGWGSANEGRRSRGYPKHRASASRGAPSPALEGVEARDLQSLV